MLEEKIAQASRPICEFEVGASESLAIGCYVEDGFGVGLDLSCAFEEESGRELVYVVVVAVC